MPIHVRRRRPLHEGAGVFVWGVIVPDAEASLSVRVSSLRAKRSNLGNPIPNACEGSVARERGNRPLPFGRGGMALDRFVVLLNTTPRNDETRRRDANA